jgi:hypothetical protein
MKPSLFFAGPLLAGGPAAAQALPSLAFAAPPTAPLTAAATAPDTAAAIHRLFAARRKRQGYVSGGTVVAAIGTAGPVAANRLAESGGSSEFGVIAPSNLDLAMVGLVAAPVVLAEALLLGGWGQQYERKALATRHQQPRTVKRRLKPTYFH